MKWTDEQLEQQLHAQAEQAGKIWERSLPQEQVHVFSEQFERKMRKLLWRRRYPWLARARTLAAVIAVCIGIGAGIQLLNSSGSGSTLEQTTGGMAQSSGDASAPSYGNLPQQDSDTDTDNRTDSATAAGSPSDDSFAAAEPTVFPAGLVEISRQQSENALTVQYASDSGAAVTYRSWYSAQPQLTGSGKTVSVDGAIAAVFSTDATQNTLEWIDANTCYALTGSLSEQELLQMADSTQKK